MNDKLRVVIGMIMSGGQTGVDQAFLRAAEACRIPTRGWMPRGFLTEDGPRPDLAQRYCLDEHKSNKYPPRTAKNIHDSDVTLIIAPWNKHGPGTRLTMTMCESMNKPHYAIDAHALFFPPTLAGGAPHAQFYSAANWLRKQRRKRGDLLIVNGAGSRESGQPGIGARAEQFLIKLFKYLDER